MSLLDVTGLRASYGPINVLRGLDFTVDEGEVVKDWVAAYRARRGRDPKVLDVAKDFNLSKTTAWRRMQA